MSLNVNRNITDSFYRYKMPKVLAKVEGKGNGIKTVIVNMVDVAKALGRPPTYPCKYFGCELGAQTQFDFKNDRYIVNGSHEASKLQVLLDGFIKRFVLCPECDNPETDLLPNERKGIIKQTCKACGHYCQLDMRHKVTTYILKNPPDIKPDHQGTSLTKRKDRKREDKNSLGADSSRAGGSDASDNDQNGDDGINWGTDTTEEAIKERQKDLTAGVKSLTVSDDVEKPLTERLEIFFRYVNGKKEEGLLKPGTHLNTYKDIAAEADRLDIRENKGVMVLVEVLMDVNILKQVQQHSVLFRLFTEGKQKTQKYVLGAIEKLIEKEKTTLLPKVSLILKGFYDFDIIDEEVLLEWGKKKSKKYVTKELVAEIHSKASPFLKWLEEAEEEDSSEEEDEEDDLEIEYDDKARIGTLKEQEAKAAPTSAPVVVAGAPDALNEDQGESEEEVDIDNL